MSDRMSIGRFARATRLTVKALRHYDELGLLRPASVDPRTGYRYYEHAQVRDAVAIATLRSLDVPLATIARVLRDPRGLAVTLAEERARLAREIEVKRRAIAGLERLMRSGSLSPYAIEVREVPALEVATVSAVSDADALEADTTRMVRELAAALEACGIAPRDPVLAILEASPDEVRIPLSVAIALPEERARREALRGSSIAVRTLPAARCAATRHIGPYPELALAHHALFAWAQAQGHDEAGPVREIYVNDPAVVAEDALITDVLLPIR